MINYVQIMGLSINNNSSDWMVVKFCLFACRNKEINWLVNHGIHKEVAPRRVIVQVWVKIMTK